MKRNEKSTLNSYRNGSEPSMNEKNEDSKGKKKKKQNMNELLLKDKGKGIEFNRKRNEQILGVNLMSREGNSPRK